MNRNPSRHARAGGATVLAALAALSLGACHYDNPHGDQALPPVTRLITSPAGATVTIERLGLRLETPCDLPETVEPGDVVAIRHPGYVPWRGELGELPQVALGTYRADLQPLR